MNILIIEDQKDLNQLITERLQKAGMKVRSAFDGEQALDMAAPGLQDLIILDRGLPDMEGLDLLEILRADGIKSPVLILTAKDELGDKITGLNKGADDYMIKPFEMEELIARIHALNRRPSETIDTVLKVGNLEFQPSAGQLKIGGQASELTAKEHEALERLMRLPDHVVSKDSLLSAIYGHGDEGSNNSIEVLMHRLRKKLEKAGATIEIKTLRGIGYLIREKTATT